ncbi:MAG: sulfite exporter TauE/SafE family protein [Fulvimarina manganoxydans]|uniref:sulfite exporter TauE/SafE family protein n=1 Tax=Fulvimarina manganoxydans TaxID=937218 RepID=UPI002354CED6|nr:sulfite exporter TauE/SafE family protein [Fulvimarina manganoxydans]MCK5933706.1 sulfite exporter TauE/SafE family protein [Fulvimarina manganoxydans]
MISPDSLGFGTWAEIAVIFVLGGMVKGAFGFGLPLTTMAMLPLFVPIEFALAINAIVMPFTNIAQFVQAGRMGETVARFAPSLLGLVLGIPLGAALVSTVRDSVLLIALGIFALAYVLLTLAKPALSIAPSAEKPLGLGVGFIAGIVGALTTASGPLFVMYLVGLKIERRLYLSALSLFFILTGVLISGTFFLAGLIDLSRIGMGGFAVLASFAGMVIGNGLAKRISAERFRLVVLSFLAILAVNLVLTGAVDLL